MKKKLKQETLSWLPYLDTSLIYQILGSLSKKFIPRTCSCCQKNTFSSLRKRIILKDMIVKDLITRNLEAYGIQPN